jgi:hypothetical protein
VEQSQKSGGRSEEVRNFNEQCQHQSKLTHHSFRASKGIKKKMDTFLQTIDASMGASALILAKWVSSDGKGSIGLYVVSSILYTFPRWQSSYP